LILDHFHLAEAEGAAEAEAEGTAEAETATVGSADGTAAAEAVATTEAVGAAPPVPASSFLGAAAEPQPTIDRTKTLRNATRFIFFSNLPFNLEGVLSISLEREIVLPSK
jgi:hypothetical protein